MKAIHFIILISFITATNCIGQAKEAKSNAYSNKIKFNLTSVLLNNYSLQYERVITKKSSIAVSFRLMPESKIPFQSQLKKIVAEEDPSLEKTIDQLRIQNFAITPEYRFYFGKGTANGFYIAPFYRYAKFKTNNVIISYSGDILDTEETINLSGDLSSHTGGLLFGAEWSLSKNIVLDWMIVGPHFGSGDGSFSGLSSRPLSPSEQQRVQQELEDLDIPFTDKTVSVNAQGASLLLDGPWGGIRAGISLGIKF